MDAVSVFALAVLAGAFIALGAVFATTVAAGASSTLPFGIVRLLSGLVFSLGLILVVVGGAELFTSNNLIVMAWANRKISTASLLRNWFIVYFGNFVGASLTAVLLYLSGQYAFGDGAIGAAALATAHAKVGLGFAQAVVLGILCNGLVLRFVNPSVMRPTAGRYRSICTGVPNGHRRNRCMRATAWSDPFWI